MTFSLTISLVAILISMVSLYISWHQYYRDRYQLNISHKIGRHTFRGKGVNALCLKIHNSGRRPVTIEQITCQTHKNKDIFGGGYYYDYAIHGPSKNQSMPIRLNENESSTISRDINKLLLNLVKNQGCMSHIRIRTGDGKSYKVKISQINLEKSLL